jgi:hypothetical protein
MMRHLENSARVSRALEAALLKAEGRNLLRAHPGLHRRTLGDVVGAILGLGGSLGVEEIAHETMRSPEQVRKACRYLMQVGVLRRRQAARQITWECVLDLDAPRKPLELPPPQGVGKDVYDAAVATGNLELYTLEILRRLAAFCDDAGRITIGHGTLGQMIGLPGEENARRRMRVLLALGWVRLEQREAGSAPRTYVLQVAAGATPSPVMRHLVRDRGEGPLSVLSPAARVYFGALRAQAEIGDPPLAVGFWLAVRSNTDGRVDVTLAQLSADTGMAPAAVTNGNEVLARDGWLSKTQEGQAYLLKVPAPWPQPM